MDTRIHVTPIRVSRTGLQQFGGQCITKRTKSILVTLEQDGVFTPLVITFIQLMRVAVGLAAVVAQLLQVMPHTTTKQ
jgi:hypothetical protein